MQLESAGGVHVILMPTTFYTSCRIDFYYKTRCTDCIRCRHAHALCGVHDKVCAAFDVVQITAQHGERRDGQL